MKALSASEWLDVFNGKSFDQIAKAILENLFGYTAKRKERWLKEDAISLEGAIVAINTRAINPHVARYQELSSLMAEVCAMVPGQLPIITVHKEGCPNLISTEIRGIHRNASPGKCDCQPKQYDLTDAAKIAAFDRVREVLYRKREAE